MLQKEKADARDSRPLNLWGRILISNQLKSMKECHWRGCFLVRYQKTAECEQIKTADMALLEEVEVDALPGSASGTDASGRRSSSEVTGGRRHEQLGFDVSAKILDATLDGLTDHPDTTGILVLDLHPVTGDMMEAFIVKKLAFNIPCFYLSLAPDEAAAESILSMKCESLANRMEEGTVKVPGFRFEKDDPEGQLERPPPRPELKILIFDEASQKVRLPAVEMRKWGMHPTLGDAFNQALESARQNLNYSEPLQSSDEAQNSSISGKRRTDVGSTPDAKKLKTGDAVTPIPVIPVQDLPSNLLMTVKMTGIKGNLTTRIFVGSKVALVNSTDDKVQLKRGTILYGFGKVSYRKVSDGEQRDMTKEIAIEFASSDDEVIYDRQLVTLFKVIENRRSMNPNAQICYHVMKDEVDKGPGCFALERRHRVHAAFEAATMKEASGEQEEMGQGGHEGKQESLAALIPLSTWAGNELAAQRWSMRWASNGLMPIRPQIVLLVDIELEPQTALRLWKE